METRMQTIWRQTQSSNFSAHLLSRDCQHVVLRKLHNPSSQALMPYSQLECCGDEVRSNHMFILVLLSTRDEELTGGAVEELQYTVYQAMWGEEGPVSLTQEEKTQQMEALLKRPDLCRHIEQCVVQQAGDGHPFTLPQDFANLSLGPHNQVCIVLNACSVPASKEFFSC